MQQRGIMSQRELYGLAAWQSDVSRILSAASLSSPSSSSSSSSAAGAAVTSTAAGTTVIQHAGAVSLATLKINTPGHHKPWPTIDIFVKMRAKDTVLLGIFWRSIEQFWPKEVPGRLIVLVDKDEEFLMDSMAIPLHAVIMIGNYAASDMQEYDKMQCAAGGTKCAVNGGCATWGRGVAWTGGSLWYSLGYDTGAPQSMSMYVDDGATWCHNV
jgi:hypothetical protein